MWDLLADGGVGRPFWRNKEEKKDKVVRGTAAASPPNPLAMAGLDTAGLAEEERGSPRCFVPLTTMSPSGIDLKFMTHGTLMLYRS